MKKIFFVIILGLFVGFLSYGQNQEVDYTLSYEETFVYFNGSSNDTIGTGDSTWTYTLRKYNLSTVYPYIYMAIDTVTGGSSDVTNIYLQTRVTPDEDFVNLDTVQYYSSADTLFVFDIPVSSTTGKKDRDWRISMEASTDDVKLEVEDLNFVILY